MTLKEFFTGRVIVFGAVLIIGFGVFAYKTRAPHVNDMGNVAPIEEQAQHGEPSIFTWKYEKSESLNGDGIPKTKVSLAITYADGTVQNKFIDTVDGTCNDLPDNDKDSVPHSTTIQCYAAGFGDDFKVTKGPHSYLVQRKEIEEASPEYNPPLTSYKVVAEIPFSDK